MLVRSCLVALVLLVAGVGAGGATAGPSEPPTMQQRLADLGGKPCPDESRLTCVTLTVPLDHFATNDPRTIDVVFGVRPASGPSKGLFVIATGGPGSAGTTEYDTWVPYFASSIPRSFDIVFFDQRGIGLSGGLTCPTAAAAYYSSQAPPADAAEAFSSACVSEMGSSSILPFVGTDQAVEDLEAFRLAVGSPPMWLYGISYGTQYAQTYAAAHPEALRGLVIDGVVDLTLSGAEFWEGSAASFERVLDRTLASCDHRAACRQNAGRPAGRIYDTLAARLAEAPVPVRFPLPSGGSVSRDLTSADLVTVAAGQLYTEYDRMMLQRAVAAAGRGDLVPLLRLAYVNLVVDPETLAAIPDPGYSDGMYYGVDCQDYGYYQGTPDERAAQFLAAAGPIGARYPKLGADVFLSDLPCAFWPSASQDQARPAPLRAEGVPTLVLTATDDPITPMEQADAVFGRLADGYLITTQGGAHGTFAWGNECPDALVTRFLVKGIAPAARESRCSGRLADAYVPLAPRTARAFGSASAAFASALREIDYLPEYYYWGGDEATAAGCPAGGGTIRFAPRGNRVAFSFSRCGFSRGFTFSGHGTYDSARDRFTLDVRAQGRFRGAYHVVRNGSTTVARPA